MFVLIASGVVNVMKSERRAPETKEASENENNTNTIMMVFVCVSVVDRLDDLPQKKSIIHKLTTLTLLR